MISAKYGIVEDKVKMEKNMAMRISYLSGANKNNMVELEGKKQLK